VSRIGRVTRETKETKLLVEVNLDGPAPVQVETGVPFFDHMLAQLGKHGQLGLTVQADGDIEIDAHHTVEDIGLVLGDAFVRALGDRAGIVRYGSATLPMDDVLVTVAVDFCGRPAFVWHVGNLDGKWIGDFDCELAKEFFAAFATRAQCNLHVVLHYGGNAHHTIECIFKAFARACDAATRVDPRLGGAVPSTKGTLTT
jgi:imidazoleglycerol-phosphate dehydratase